MKSLNVEHINPFLMGSTQVLNQMCSIEAKVGRPYISDPISANESIIIMIGITGELRGQVVMSFQNDVAVDIASKMMGMPVVDMDDMAKSAIGELGNMILGTTATIFSSNGISVDITPPTIGDGRMTFSSSHVKNICVPLIYEDNKTIEINLSVAAK